MAGPLPGPDGLRNVRKPGAADPFGEPVGNAAGNARPPVNHCRIELDQARPCADAVPGVVRIGDAADADQRYLAPRSGAELPKGFERERLERLARKAAGLVTIAGLEKRPRNRRVRDDDRIDPVLDGGADDLVGLSLA